MVEAGQELRFGAPPVRNVQLQLFMERIPQLRITALAEYIHLLKADLPIAKERYGLLPWASEDREDEKDSDVTEASGDAESLDDFPFPYLSFEDGSGNELAFQDDRFELSWTFSEGRSYPGFEALSAELIRRFEQFASVVQSVSENVPLVRKVVLRYSNEIPNMRPVSVAQRLFGYPDASPAEPLVDLDVSVFHGDLNVEDPDGDVALTFTAGIGRSPQPFLGIQASTYGSESNDKLVDPLSRAHDQLIAFFVTLTTEEQKEGWQPL